MVASLFYRFNIFTKNFKFNTISRDITVYEIIYFTKYFFFSEVKIREIIFIYTYF